MKRRPPLPKLPYGSGTMFYNDRGDVVYKKMVYLADGSRFRKTVIESTAPECMKRMTRIEEDLLKVTDIASLTKKTSLREEINYWLDNVKKNTLKTQSWERLESNVRINILDSPIGNKKVLDITSKDLQKLINGMNNGHYSHSSIKKVYDALNDFFRYISKRDQMNNPMESVICVSKYNTIKEIKEVDYLDQSDMEKFIDQALAVWESSGNPRYRYGNVIVANLYMGLWIGELLALKWRDVCFDKDYVVVNKTGDFVVATRTGKSTTPKNIQDAIGSILKNADTKMQSSNTHIMRHTCASLLFRNGIDLNTIARILGNSEDVLKKTYVHFDDDNLRRIIEQIADIE